jgi:hypothetical protein
MSLICGFFDFVACLFYIFTETLHGVAAGKQHKREKQACKNYQYSSKHITYSCRFREIAFTSQLWPSPPGNKENDREDDSDNKQNPGDIRRQGGDTR